MKFQKVNESSTLAAMLHGTVVKAEHWTLDDGRTAIVLDYADGQSLFLAPNPDAKRFMYGEIAPKKAT